MKRAALALFVLAVGCPSVPDALAPVVELADLAAPCIEARAYEAAWACGNDRACIERERARWTAAAATLDAARALWRAHFEHPACKPEHLP